MYIYHIICLGCSSGWYCGGCCASRETQRVVAVVINLQSVFGWHWQLANENRWGLSRIALRFCLRLQRDVISYILHITSRSLSRWINKYILAEEFSRFLVNIFFYNWNDSKFPPPSRQSFCQDSFLLFSESSDVSKASIHCLWTSKDLDGQDFISM